jgi:hypothetical protein
MNGNNLLFSNDPFWYAQNRLVNVLNMSVANEKGIGPGALKTAFNYVFTLDYEYAAEKQILHEKAAVLSHQDTKRTGKFDLEPSDMNVALRVCNTSHGAIPTGLGSEQPIRAYWLPYVSIGMQGKALAGVPYVDIPSAAPTRNFVFTGSMNGCSLVITRIAGGFRVYHDSTHNPNLFIGQNVVLRLDYDQTVANSPYVYGDNGQPATTKTPTSFNFLYFKNASWYLVCQPQLGFMGTKIKFNKRIPPFRVQVV